MTTLEIMRAAKEASYGITSADTDTKNRALSAMADALEANADAILAANAADCEKAKDTVTAVMLDRLLLTKERIGSSKATCTRRA